MGETGEVQRVIAAAIPHRENQLGTGRRCAVVIAISGGVETVDGIARAGFEIGAIELLHRGDIIQQWRRCVGTFAAVGEVLTGVAFAPVAHDAVGTGVFAIHRIAVSRVAIAGVVVSRVRQPKGVADFVGQGLATVVALARGFVDRIVLVDQVPRFAFARTAGQVGKRRAAVAGTEIGKGHVAIPATGCRAFGERHLGDIGPGLQRQLGLFLLQRRKLAERAQATGGVTHRRRREEGIGEVDHTIAVEVMPTGPGTRELIRGLVGGERRFAIDQMITAIIEMAEVINLSEGRTAGVCRLHLANGQCCFLFKFRHVNISLFSSRKFFDRPRRPLGEIVLSLAVLWRSETDTI